MKRRAKSEERRAQSGAVLLALAVSLGAVTAGDINKGYTFTPGEKNVTHTKLNSLVDGASINPSFFTDKSATTAPAAADLMLLYSSAYGDFRKASLDSVFLSNTNLIWSQTEYASPPSNSYVLVLDQTNGYRKVQFANLFSNWPSYFQPATLLPSLTNPTNSTLLLVWDNGTNGFGTNGAYGTVPFASLAGALATNLPIASLPAYASVTNNAVGVLTVTNDALFAVWNPDPTNGGIQQVPLSTLSNSVSPQRFTAGPFALSAGVVASLYHPWSNSVPEIVRWVLVCTNATADYNAGDEVDVHAVAYSTTTSFHVPFSGGASATNLFLYLNAVDDVHLWISGRSGMPSPNFIAVDWNAKVYAEHY